MRTSVTRLLDYFSTFGPMTSMKICPKVYKICQSRLKILANSKYSFEKLPKTLNILPNWRNFAKSGHTGEDSLLS